MHTMTYMTALRDAIQQRYPCSELPRGAAITLAAEFGVSRQRVSQVLQSLGYGVVASIPLPRPVCASCGAEMGKQSKALVCRPCRWVDVPCTECSEPVRRLLSEFVRQNGRMNLTPRGPAAYTGRVFCNKLCYGRWWGKHYGRGRKGSARTHYVADRVLVPSSNP